MLSNRWCWRIPHKYLVRDCFHLWGGNCGPGGFTDGSSHSAQRQSQTSGPTTVFSKVHALDYDMKLSLTLLSLHLLFQAAPWGLGGAPTSLRAPHHGVPLFVHTTTPHTPDPFSFSLSRMDIPQPFLTSSFQQMPGRWVTVQQ